MFEPGYNASTHSLLVQHLDGRPDVQQSTAEVEAQAVYERAALERRWNSSQDPTSSGRSLKRVSLGPSVTLRSARGGDSAERCSLLRRRRQRSRVAAVPVKPPESAGQAAEPSLHDPAERRFLASIRNQLQHGRTRYMADRQVQQSDDAVSVFLHNLGHTGLLSKEQEVRLARIVHRGLRAEEARARLAVALDRPPTHKHLASELGLQSEAHLAEILHNMAEAKDLMIQYNLRLVVAVAKKYANHGVELRDLIPEGIAGLTKAIAKFDPAKGFKFSTYAHWWIRQAISRSISEQSRVVRLPVHISDTVSRIQRVMAQLNSQPDRVQPATHEEVGAVLGLSAARVRHYLCVSQPVRSLEAPAYAGDKDGDDSVLLGDTIAVVDDSVVESRVLDKLIREDINAVLSTLPPRERNVIRMRYGLHHPEGKSMTFNDIGAAYGLTKERIRQIEDKALTKLKLPWRRQMLRAHLYRTGI
ncbi:hypothetical protein WJX72_001922 [[Myrmecia] bisecta]|uniref:RNA polymerase sigma-70 domain-containing protein n=1 Tax=[Myrmecia] bisecta TaxID=41462 RepID=A0AAW1P801_9CHLO